MALLVGAALLAASPSWAQQPAGKPPSPAPAPAPTKAAKPAYEVKGFRSAMFGMTEAEVKAAIVKDFGAKPDDIRSVHNALERTTALTVTLPSLDPGPGPAVAAYIMGYQSKKLIQVNVVWAQDPKADKVDTGPYIVAGVQLVNYFNEFSWRDGKVGLGIPAGPSSLVLFAAEDEKTGAVQVTADGVALERKSEGRIEAAPKSAGQISLRVSYIANRTAPDVFRLKGGF
jgi:hypothetical protein